MEDAMDRRRMMMAEGKPKPLYIFQAGYSAFPSNVKTAARASTTTWVVADNYIGFYENNTRVMFKDRTVRLQIPLDRRYRKLFVTANGSVLPAHHSIGWSTDSNDRYGNEIEIGIAANSSAPKVYEFDISKRDKSSEYFYLFFNAPINIDVYDIHFE